MCNKCRTEDKLISVEEIRQQLRYARVISGELFNLFAVKSPENSLLPCEYSVVETKLSMLLDFLFQADIWCDIFDNDSEACNKNQQSE